MTRFDIKNLFLDMNCYSHCHCDLEDHAIHNSIKLIEHEKKFMFYLLSVIIFSINLTI